MLGLLPTGVRRFPMLLGSLDLLFSDPLAFLRLFPIILATMGFALLLGITVHEFSHALVAYSLGDLTAKRLGRLSLNPIRHLDPMGTALLVIVGFGWGKPVPINPYALRRGRQGMAAVAAAGPLSNVITASLFTIPIRAGGLAWHSPFFFSASFQTGINGFLADLVGFIIFFNIILAVFNLLPFFPLDGSRVVLGLLPRDLGRTFARLETHGPVLLLMVIALDVITGAGILSRIMIPVVNYVGHVIIGQGFY